MEKRLVVAMLAPTRLGNSRPRAQAATTNVLTTISTFKFSLSTGHLIPDRLVNRPQTLRIIKAGKIMIYTNPSCQHCIPVVGLSLLFNDKMLLIWCDVKVLKNVRHFSFSWRRKTEEKYLNKIVAFEKQGKHSSKQYLQHQFPPEQRHA